MKIPELNSTFNVESTLGVWTGHQTRGSLLTRENLPMTHKGEHAAGARAQMKAGLLSAPRVSVQHTLSIAGSPSTSPGKRVLKLFLLTTQAASQEVERLPVLSGVSIALFEVLEKLGVLMPLLYGLSLATGL